MLNISCNSIQLGEEFVNSAGRRARTFRLSYDYSENANTRNGEGETARVLTNEEAEIIHNQLRGRIPSSYSGAECR